MRNRAAARGARREVANAEGGAKADAEATIVAATSAASVLRGDIAQPFELKLKLGTGEWDLDSC